MSKLFSLIFPVLFFATSMQGQFSSLKELIPSGFTILDSVSGDLNKDGIKDLIVVLKNSMELEKGDTTRPLLIFQGVSGNKLKLLERNDKVVLCKECGGVYGDPYEGLVIKNGYFSVQHYGGSNWRWTRIITFRYDSKKKKFILHRDAGESWNIMDSVETKQNLYHKELFNKIQFRDYSVYKE